MNGGLRLACNPDRWIEVKRQATTARSFGLEMHLLSPKEARDLWPLMDVSDVIGAAFLPTDGQANPSDIAQSLAKGARTNGATIFEGVAVVGFEIARGRVAAVETSRGRDRLRSTSSIAPGNGRARSASSPASTCRWSRCSISTSSPRRSPA